MAGSSRIIDPWLPDRIAGVMFGQAIGDALGLGTEAMFPDEVLKHYPTGLHDFEQIIWDKHRRWWRKGDWTDDTDQMICILDTLLARGEVLPTEIAIYLNRWRVQNGRGIGLTVQTVMKQDDFLENPHAAAERVWELSGRHLAANGAVMRTSVLGVWDFWDPAKVRANAESACKVTHFDPRCVASCVMASHLIAATLRGEAGPEALLEEAALIADEYDPRAREYIELAKDGNLPALQLADADSMGYTLKAMAAGIWAWMHASDFESGLLAVVNAGGDADTNAAVAGAMMGAKFGKNAMPKRWLEGLNWQRLLGELTDRLIQKIFNNQDFSMTVNARSAVAAEVPASAETPPDPAGIPRTPSPATTSPSSPPPLSSTPNNASP